MEQASSRRRRGLPPVIAEDARVLILGSFPSEASLAARQYYAHPRNQFWSILGAVLDEPLPKLSYTDRLARVRAHRVAIWDTIVACVRAGSLDAAIRDARRGEADRVRRVARGLVGVCFNGQTAAKSEPVWRACGYKTRVLPSTSPAHTQPIDKKIAAWRTVTELLEDG